MNLSRAAGVVAAGLLLGSIVLLSLGEGERVETPRSVASTEDEGRRAAHLLLEGLGFEPEVWRQRPGLLPRGPHLLFLPAVPRGPIAELEEQAAREEGAEEAPAASASDPFERARASGLRSPRHYRGFLETGGRVLAPLSGEMLAFLVDEVGLSELDGARVEALEADDGVRRPVELAEPLGGERLELELRDAWQLVDLALDLPREALARTPAGAALALDVPIGRGGVILLAGEDFLDNLHLRGADNALFWVRLVEALDRGGRLLFDEGALGRVLGGTKLSLALAPDLRLASVHFVLLLLLAVWFLAWPRPFPRDPEPLDEVAPLSRARAQAALALRAGRPEVLASMLRAGTLRRLMRRAHLRTAADEPAEARLTRLMELAAREGGPATPARLRELLSERSVTSRAQLAALDAELRALESRASESAGANPEPPASRS